MPNTCEDLGSVGPQHQGETKWQRVEGEKKGETEKERRKKESVYSYTYKHVYIHVISLIRW